jgi:tetratricopeptide (TPR) repeat protein
VESYERAAHLATATEDRATAYWLLGRAYWRQDNYEEALFEFNKAIALRPHDAIYYMVMTNSYRELGRAEEGLKIIQEAVEKHPENPQFLEILGGAYLNLRRPEEAIAALTEAIRLNPYYGDAYFSMGNAYRQLDSLTNAVSCYRKAKRLGILYYGDRNYYLLLARSYLDLGMYDHAAEELLKALQRESDDAVLHWFLGVAYMYQDQYDKAIAELRTTAELMPEAGYPYLMLGVVYNSLGRYEQAVVELRTARHLDPDNVYAKFFYSLSLHYVGKAEEGRALFRQLGETVEGDSWENSIAGFLAGELDETALLSLAKDEDPRFDRGHRCEAYYYIGMAYLLDTDADLESARPDTVKAQAYFERCLDTGVSPADYPEHGFARAELARLQGD